MATNQEQPEIIKISETPPSDNIENDILVKSTEYQSKLSLSAEKFNGNFVSYTEIPVFSAPTFSVIFNRAEENIKKVVGDANKKISSLANTTNYTYTNPYFPENGAVSTTASGVAVQEEPPVTTEGLQKVEQVEPVIATEVAQAQAPELVVEPVVEEATPATIDLDTAPEVSPKTEPEPENIDYVRLNQLVVKMVDFYKSKDNQEKNFSDSLSPDDKILYKQYPDTIKRIAGDEIKLREEIEQDNANSVVPPAPDPVYSFLVGKKEIGKIPERAIQDQEFIEQEQEFIENRNNIEFFVSETNHSTTELDNKRKFSFAKVGEKIDNFTSKAKERVLGTKKFVSNWFSSLKEKAELLKKETFNNINMSVLGVKGKIFEKKISFLQNIRDGIDNRVGNNEDKLYKTKYKLETRKGLAELLTSAKK